MGEVRDGMVVALEIAKAKRDKAETELVVALQERDEAKSSLEYWLEEFHKQQQKRLEAEAELVVTLKERDAALDQLVDAATSEDRLREALEGAVTRRLNLEAEIVELRCKLEEKETNNS